MGTVGNIVGSVLIVGLGVLILSGFIRLIYFMWKGR